MIIFRGGRDSFGGRLLIARLLQGPLVADGIPPLVLIDALQAESPKNRASQQPMERITMERLADGMSGQWAPGEDDYH